MFEGASVEDVLNVSKWRFLVTSTAKLNEVFGEQKTVRLSVLEKKGCCIETKFKGLKTAVDGIAEGLGGLK
jgi:hypothetical protein